MPATAASSGEFRMQAKPRSHEQGASPLSLYFPGVCGAFKNY